MLPVAPALLPLLLSQLQIVGASTCPAPALLERRLRATLGAAFDELDHQLRVDSTDHQLDLRLTDRDGSLLGERILQSQGSCDELAEAAALVVSVWEGVLPGPTLGVPAGLVRRVTPGPSPETSAAPWEFGGSVSDAFAGGFVIPPGAALSVTRGWGHFWGRLALAGDLPDQLSLGPGQVRWTRPALDVGGAYRFEPSVGSFEVEAALVAALLVVYGSDFTANRSQPGFDAGLRLTGRFYLGHARWRPWLEVSGLGWLNADQVEVQGVVGTRTLPQLQLAAALGAACRFN